MAQKRVTLKDIAAELNVSVTTISKVLNEHPDISPARRREVLDALERRNYIANQYARNLRTNSSKLVAVIVPDNMNPYNAIVTNAMQRALSEADYHPMILNTYEDPAYELRLIRELIAINIAGVLISPARGESAGIDLLAEHEIPHILFNRTVGRTGDSFVIADDYTAAKIGAEYLLSHYSDRKLLYVCNDLSITTARERLAGVRDAMREAGGELSDDALISGVFNDLQASEKMQEIIKEQGKKLAILGYSDFLSLGLMRGAWAAGLSCPEDVAIVGIDGIASYQPFLTSVRIPIASIGRTATELLVRAIRGETEEVEAARLGEDIRLVKGNSA